MRWHSWVVVFSMAFILAGAGAGAEAPLRKARGTSSERASPVKRDEANAVAAQPKLDLNSATTEELATLPGIGPKRARAIVAYRERHRFARTRELRRIRGIGPKTFQRLQAHVVVGGGDLARRTVQAVPGRHVRAPTRR